MTVSSCLCPLMTTGHFVVRQNDKSGINKNKGTLVEINCKDTDTMVVSKFSITTPEKKKSVIVIPFIIIY